MSADGRIKADDVWEDFRRGHVRKQVKGLLPFQGLLTGTDCSIVGNHCRHTSGNRHACKQLQCPLPLRGLLIGTDSRTEADDIGRDFVGGQVR